MSDNRIRIWMQPRSGEWIQLEDERFAADLDAVTRQLPAGYYTTFRTFDGGKRAMGLNAHFRRLYQPDIKPYSTSEALRQQLRFLLQPYSHDARARIIVSHPGEIYILVQTFQAPPERIYHEGVSVRITDIQRLDPRQKSTRFIARSDQERKQLSSSNAYESLLVKNDRILEGLTSNFLYCTESCLGTARKGILLGVTRQTVIRVARGLGIDILYRALKVSQVAGLTEAFITSSSRGIVPVVKIGQDVIGSGKPGKLTQILMAGYRDYIWQQAEMI
jgi:branched-chain amino acid aminotransferase